MSIAITAIEAAWWRIFPQLCGAAAGLPPERCGGFRRDELRARLQRRQTNWLTKVPRACCLAVRASDFRLDVPLAALESPSYDGLAPVINLRQRATPGGKKSADIHRPDGEHRIEFTAPRLRALCGMLDFPNGLSAPRTANLLGLYGVASLRASLRRGALQENVHHDHNGREMAGPGLALPGALSGGFVSHTRQKDRSWGMSMYDLSTAVPADFSQTVLRRPRLRETEKRRPKNGHHGYEFLCPACGKPVEVLLLPFGMMTLPQYLRHEPTHLAFRLHQLSRALSKLSPPSKSSKRNNAGPSRQQKAKEAARAKELQEEMWQSEPFLSRTERELYALHKPLMRLACGPCHHATGHRQATGAPDEKTESIRRSWSLLVSHITGGLLYGHEVTRPEGMAGTGRRQKRTTRKPTRDRVAALFAAGKTIEEIAAELGITYSAVGNQLWALRDDMKLTSRLELLRALRPGVPEAELYRQRHPRPRQRKKEGGAEEGEESVQ